MTSTRCDSSAGFVGRSRDFQRTTWPYEPRVTSVTSSLLRSADSVCSRGYSSVSFFFAFSKPSSGRQRVVQEMPRLSCWTQPGHVAQALKQARWSNAKVFGLRPCFGSVVVAFIVLWSSRSRDPFLIVFKVPSPFSRTWTFCRLWKGLFKLPV